MSALNVLLNGLIDYAGLFPPAALDMPEAVQHYAECRQGPCSSMLGLFVLPIARLDEFDRALGALRPDHAGPAAWRLSALAGNRVDADLAAATAYGASAGPVHRAVIDSIEMTAGAPADVERTVGVLPPRIRVAFEILLQVSRVERAAILEAVRRSHAMAKLRTGGLTPSAIPSPEQVAEFIWDSARARVPFKATAGLHHPIRGEHRLTSAADSPSAVMHGFLNVFVAAAVAWSLAAEGGTALSADLPPDVLAIIEERDAACFTLGADRIRWRDIDVPLAAIERARADFARSFGSCSFNEPVSDLNALGWLR